MAIFYPRKQTVIISIICSLLVIGALYYANADNLNTKTSEKSNIIANTQVISSTSDEFGSSNDWKTQFNGTTTLGGGKNEQKILPEENLSKTDKFGRDFFSRFVELSQANLLSNQDVVNQTASDLVTSNMNESPKVYEISDLNIVSSTDQVSLQKFSQAVAKVLEQNRLSKTESSIVNDFMTGGDPSVLSEIDPITKTYDKILTSLLSIPTPQIMAKEEVDLINSFSSMEFASHGFRVMDSDTFQALSSVKIHADGATLLINTLTNMFNTLKSKGVAFDFDQSVLNTLLN